MLIIFLYIYRVRTPGNRLTIQYLKKLHLKHRSVPKCAETGVELRGVLPQRGNYKNKRRSLLSQRRRIVSRRYGGNLSHTAVRERILRAFLVEEARITVKINKSRSGNKQARKLQRKKRKKQQKKKKQAKKDNKTKSNKKSNKKSTKN